MPALPHYTLQEAVDAGWKGQDAVKFASWMDGVSRAIQETIGLTIHDVPDWMWADAYTSGMSAAEAAEEYISSELEEWME